VTAVGMSLSGTRHADARPPMTSPRYAAVTGMQSHEPERLRPTAGGAGARTRQPELPRSCGVTASEPHTGCPISDGSAHAPRAVAFVGSSGSNVNGRITGTP
jgi:hypothetical protein